jgi:hypothetical protein
MSLCRIALLLWLAAGLVVAGGPGSASGRSAGAPAGAPAGANLLLNPSAEAGAFSVQGWDAVTIPGWEVVRGLPTVVRYGTRKFPAVGPTGGGGQLFAGGAGGTAQLTQTVSLRRPGGGLEPAGTRYAASAWLGGDAPAGASLIVSLSSLSGQVLARQTVGPVSGRLALRSVAGCSRTAPRGRSSRSCSRLR